MCIPLYAHLYTCICINTYIYKYICTYVYIFIYESLNVLNNFKWLPSQGMYIDRQKDTHRQMYTKYRCLDISL